MNKNILFQLVVFSVISSFELAQTPSLNWVNQTGASNAVVAMDIESDASGNTYVTGFSVVPSIWILPVTWYG